MDYGRLDRPESIPERFVKAWNDRDAARLASVFDEDAEFVNVTGLWWHDRAAIQAAHAYGLERIFSQSVLRVINLKVKHMREDVAIVHARTELTHQNPFEGLADPGWRRNIISFVVHRSAEGWSCASAHNTDVAPGAETNIVDAEGRLRPVSYRQRIERRG